MNEQNVFEVAVRTKMRFPFRGMVSVEDLWDLNVTNLDSIFKTLNAELKQAKEESLLDVRTTKDKELDMKIEIVKYIVQVKVAEAEVRSQAKEKREQKQKIMEIIARKENEETEGKSLDELRTMLEEI